MQPTRRFFLAAGLLVALSPALSLVASDQFADRVFLPSGSGRLEASTHEATAEPGEPARAGVAPTRSVWFAFTAERGGVLELSTLGSTFDTVLAVYRGDRVDRLIEVAANDDGAAAFGTESHLRVPLEAGIDYSIVIDGFDGAAGLAWLIWHSTEGAETLPPHDAFADRETLRGGAGLVVSSNRNATREAFEPPHVAVATGASVWWSWTPTRSGRASWGTEGSTADTVLAVYRGGRLEELIEVATDDDSGENLAARLEFDAARGVEYQIAVSGKGGEEGLVVLERSLRDACVAPPVNAKAPAHGAQGIALRPRFSWEGLPSGTAKLIYGEDGRREYFELRNPALRRAAEATAVVVERSALTLGPEGTYTIAARSFGDKFSLCPGERFAAQPAPGWCTAFLVASDLVVTAGHCLADPLSCSEMAFVFGFHMVDEKTPVQSFPASRVFTCAEIIDVFDVGGDDWGIVQLDRPVPDLTPLRIRRSGGVAPGADLVVLGHPGGIPLKVAFGAEVRENDAVAYFVANADAYVGNSGSPVLDFVTGVVEGVLVSGDDDFVRVSNCLRSRVCPEHGCLGEAVTRTTRFADLVPPHPESYRYELFLGPRGALRLVAEVGEPVWTPDENLEPDTSYCWRVVARTDCGMTEGPVWSFRTGSEFPDLFRRGEASGDGVFDLSDPIAVLSHLFLGAPLGSGCPDAADADDSGALDITDPIYLLVHQFLGGESPPAPFELCGEDPTPDPLECEISPTSPACLE